MKVLLGTDGTSSSIEAAGRVLRLLHPDAELEVVTVIPETEDPNAMAGGFEGPLITEEEAQRNHEDETRRAHEALDATLDAVRVPASSEIIQSSHPGQALCDLAAERHVDLLVVGGTDKSWFRRLVQGSAMEYAVHHAPCPVLIVRDADDH